MNTPGGFVTGGDGRQGGSLRVVAECVGKVREEVEVGYQ